MTNEPHYTSEGGYAPGARLQELKRRLAIAERAATDPNAFASPDVIANQIAKIKAEIATLEGEEA